MSKRKKIDTSKVILTSIIVFFTIILFLSLPVLFNYNSMQNIIEKKFYSEFKINLKILDDISFKIFPKPHYLVKKANLDLNNNDDKSSIVETSNLKIIIPTKKIYSKTDLIFNKVEITNANIYFKMEDIKDFRKHLYYKINGPISIKKSNFFLLDDNNKPILISPIKKLNYLINVNNNFKELKIKGNIFDVDYYSSWKRYYDKPKKTLNDIILKNPNLSIKNLFLYEDRNNFKGSSSISFLNENIVLNYLMKDNSIYIESPINNRNQNIKINSTIELDPFFFDAKIDINKKDINFLIDNLLSIILNYNDEYIGNINGKLTLVLNNLKNPLFNSGVIKFSIKEKVIKLENSLFEIANIGKLKSNFRYYENKGDIIFASENIFEISNKKEFSRKFQLNSKKINDINKIYFDLEKNIDSKEFFISNIHLNKIDEKKFTEDFYKIKNIHIFRALIRNILS